MQEFANRSVLVTGGASGIGRGIVEGFAAAGAAVVFADIDGARGEETRRQVAQATGNERVSFAQADLSDKDAIDSLVAQAQRETGDVDVLVNNVGANPAAGSIVQHRPEDFEQAFRLNVMSCVHCIRGVLPAMLARKRGAIVNIASTMALGAAGFSAYTMSKGAIVTLTKTLALDHAREGVRINAVAPGLIATPATRPWIAEQQDAAAAKGVPMGIVGQPRDIANAVMFLASDKAAYITGHVLVVDGGLSVGE